MSSAALPITHAVLRILIILNWIGGAAILALLVVSPNERWIMAAFKLSPSPEAARLVMGLRVIAGLGLVVVPLHYVVLKRLLDAEFHIDLLPNLICIVATGVIANVAGWLASFRILGQKPLEVLRHQ